MKRWLGNLFLGLMFVAGLAVLLYPAFSDWYNSKVQAQAIAQYTRRYSELNQEEVNHLWDEAQQYNASLAEIGTHQLTDEELAEYNEVLSIDGSGMIGFINIEKLGVELPIYHSVEDPVLQKYVGHLPGTSLPVGGESTHAVLSGHRGLPSSRLFTDLDKMVVGDRFLLNILGQTLAYEVDDIRTVEPTEVGSLRIEQGADQVTLVTCTPYGINSHRLLVRGHRIAFTASDMIAANAVPLDQLLVTSIVAVPTFALLLVGYVVITWRKNRQLKRQVAAEEAEPVKNGTAAPIPEA